MKDKLIIFDTTLRDGEQSPGTSMTRDEKLPIARQLARMRVDVLEAGFPAASNACFESRKAVASTIRRQYGVRPGAGQRGRYPARGGGAGGRKIRAHSHFPRHFADPHGEETACSRSRYWSRP